MRYLESKHAQVFNQNDIRSYIAMLLYHGVVHKPIYHMYYTNDKISETPGFRKLFPSVNSYLLRNTSTLSIYQNLVKVTIVHPPRTNSYLLRNKSALLIYQNLVKVIIVHTSRINSYLLRNTSTLLIYQNLVKVIIIHPKLIQYTNILLRTGNHFSPQIVMFQLTMHYFYGRED